MTADEQVQLVQRMQDALESHAGDSAYTINNLYAAFAYSKRHADRMFHALTGKTPAAYLRLVRLSAGAKKLVQSETAVLDVALETGFDSHEGFSRAFKQSFRVAPQTYRREHVPIPLLLSFPVCGYQTYLKNKERKAMEQSKSKCWVCTATLVERPKRRLILLRAKSAQDYWSFCEEMGCEWTGLFNSIPEKFDTAALVNLPDDLIVPGTASVAAGVETPLSYDVTKLPAGYEAVVLEPATMLYFESEPYENEDDYCDAIDAAFRASETYDYAKHGLEFDPKAAPTFNFGADATTGGRITLPVRVKKA